jgi:hypothetical protein
LPLDLLVLEHLAAQVVSAEDFLLNDPFILLMDDHLDIGDRTMGEPPARRLRNSDACTGGILKAPVRPEFLS